MIEAIKHGDLTGVDYECLTDEQRAIVDFAITGQDMKVIAFAGVGKTFVLVRVAKAFGQRARLLYISFNSSIAKEARSKFPANTDCVTIHALAKRLGAVMSLGEHRFTNSSRDVTQAFKAHPALHSLQGFYPRKRAGGYKNYLLSTLVLRVVEKYCNAAHDDITAAHIPLEDRGRLKDWFGEDQRDRAAELLVGAARAFWAALTDPRGKYPFSFGHYLKHWVLTNPTLPYNTILFDEAQDSSGVMSRLVEAQTDAQKIYVGDPYQQIYAWRGAINAMAGFDAPEFPLTGSFRFGSAVAALANNVLRDLGERRPLRGLAEQRGDVNACFGDGESGYTILCRTNMGVVERVLQLISNKRVAVVGGTKALADAIRGAYDLYTDNYSKHPSFRDFEGWAQLRELSGTEEGRSFRLIVDFVERYDRKVPEIVELLESSSEDERQADVIISTAHKAKGREWDRVMLNDDFGFYKNKAGDVDRPEEANLLYVAMTRAMRELDKSQLRPGLVAT